MNERARKLIRERMEQKKISQVDLAERLSMTSSQVSRILSGDRGTTLENIIAIADCLGLERNHLLRLASGLPPEPEEDVWVDEMAHKLTQLSPGSRNIAERFIDSMVEGEEANRQKERKNRKPSPATK